MKRHHGNLLARPSFRGMLSHYFREMKLTCAYSFHPRKKRLRRKSKKGITGGLDVMLTALLLLVQLARTVLALPVYQFRTFPRLATSGICGVIIATMYVLSCAQWPEPTTALDFTGLVSTPAETEIAWTKEDSTTTIESHIPPELYEDYVDPVRQHPILIASISLPGETWRSSYRSTDLAPNISGTTAKKSVTPIKPKSTIQVPLTEGTWHVVRKGDNLWDLAKAYAVNTNKLVAYNNDMNPRNLKVGQKVFIPGVNSPLPAIPKQNRMILPIKHRKAYIISGYGMRKHPIGGNLRFHQGVDLQPVYVGTPIYSVLSGVVEYAARKGGKGLMIRIKHDNGLKTVYAHNSKLYVRKGDRVNQGQKISLGGSTGYSTGPHLHFEVWKDRKHVNPVKYLPKIRTKSRRR
ncbi:peptidoglycan DD-metalloendopeptidase family protein [bacterium]|nr:peptidoglycan DD-metalloendopeptidase family protein [bacterium]